MSHSLPRVTVVAGLMIAIFTGHALAATDLGEFCFGSVGVTDTIQISATLATGPEPIAELHFRWRGPNYLILGSGAATIDPSDQTVIDIGLVGTHNTANFGGNPQCSLYATLSNSTAVGPFAVTCTGSGGAPFTASGTLAPITCN